MLHVGQFRRILFKPTETFLYNYMTAFRHIVPICFTFQRENADLFPFQHPIVELYEWDAWNKGLRRVRQRVRRQVLRDDTDLSYNLSKTFKAIQKYNVQVIHAHFGYTGCRVLPVKHKTGLPLVTTFYGEDISALPRCERWRRAYAQLFAEGDLFLVEGPYMQKRLCEIGCPSEKASIQRIAVQMDRYPFRHRLPKGKGETVRIFFCGSFREKKGLVYALDAVRRVHERFSNLEFRIIGDGELRPQVEQAVDRFQMHSYTTLLGFQSHQRMIEEMNAADIFIHPSVTAENGDSEGGAPTTILEAQACGLPVVSTTHADIPNVVTPGESALLAPERDAETLSDHLCTLLSEPECWGKMGMSGRAFVETNHNIDTEVKSLEDKYHTLAGISGE
jgi:colanic acid/amylovoran biosynthesis glycosyltransferase